LSSSGTQFESQPRHRLRWYTESPWRRRRRSRDNTDEKEMLEDEDKRKNEDVKEEMMKKGTKIICMSY
jgi:hypothetical protein